MIVSHDIGIWCGALLTLAIFSFLYKDNPIYKFAEYLFMGLSAGYMFALTYWQAFLPKLWDPLTKSAAAFSAAPGWPHFWDLLKYVVPGLLGIIILTRLVPRIGWMSRWAMAFVVGVGTAIALYSNMQGQVLAQLQGTMVPLAGGPDLTAGVMTNHWLILIGVCASLAYFYFSKPHTGAFGAVSKVGIWFLMVTFGAGFGYTVMARISLLIGRVLYLMGDWLGLIKV